ncbi:MAG: efflux RND transporter periplasmic adaptor subunit [Thiotrichales bacterium]
MNTARFTRLVLGVALLAGLAGGWWWLTQAKPVSVTLAEVTRTRVEAAVSNTRAGTVEACRRAKMSPSLGGQIARLQVRDGARVKAGELLLELWNQDLQAELVHGERQGEALTAQTQATCYRAAAAEREAERLGRLAATSAVSVDALDKARTQARAARAECDAARVGIQVNAAQIATLRANLERTRLYAPFDGVVAKINGELNEYVTPSPPGIATLAVIDLIDNTCFYVKAPIDEVDAARIEPGMEARITLDAYGERAFAGTVRRLADFVLDVEKQARTVDVEAELRNPEDLRLMLAGYSADVEVILERRDDTLAIPTEAIVDGNQVFVYHAGVLARRTIETGLSNWKLTEVRHGLAADERVVLSVGRAGVSDGARAEPDPES